MPKGYDVIIPARGGSKGIPKKNIIDFCGKPLIAWTILQAQKSAMIDNVYVSSDDDEILEVAGEYGAIPVVRPAKLATDEATSESALLHVMDIFNPKIAVFLQATSPLRTSEDITKAVYTMITQKADSLFSACVLDDYCIWKKEPLGLRSINFDYKNRVRRQLREPYYLENGSIFVFRPWVLRECNNRLGGKIAMYEMPFWKSFEIDQPEDVGICEWYFRERLLSSLK